MKLEEFLSPISEQEVNGRNLKVSDEEIFRSVQDMAEAEQMIEHQQILGILWVSIVALHRHCSDP